MTMFPHSMSMLARMLRKLKELGYNPADYPDNKAWRQILDQPRRLTDRSMPNTIAHFMHVLMAT